MAFLIKNVRVIDSFADIDVTDDVIVAQDRIEIAPTKIDDSRIIDGRGLLLVPGLIDLHVHFREPGFIHKEDISSGIRAALAGGVTSALVMPNTSPAIDSFKRVKYQLGRASSCGFDLMVSGAASLSLLGQEPTDVGNLKRAGAKAITDDGRPILDASMMEEILRRCRMHDVVCMQHAEDLHISHGASLNLGRISNNFGLCGQPNAAEFKLIERDIALAEKIGARYHILHLSCEESLRLVRSAKLKRARVSCEVTPHHLLLSECDVRGLNANKKMNPPLRSKADVDALVSGLSDGSIDAVASDHAPHSHKEKCRSFEKAPFGVVGLESAILVLMTLVKRGKLPLTRAVRSMTMAPAKILGEPLRLGTMFGEQALKNAVLIDPNHCGIFSERNLVGRSKNSPFIGMELYGRVVATFLNGKLAYWSK